MSQLWQIFSITILSLATGASLCAHARENAGAPLSPLPQYASLQDRSYSARAAYEANPNDVVAATNFAILQMQIGDRELAQSIFSAAQKLHPDDYIASLGLAQALANDPEQGAPAALRQLEKAERLPPPSGHNFTRLVLTGDCYIAINAFPQALSVYKQARQLNQADRSVLEKCTRAALAAGEIDLARTYLPQLQEKEVNDQSLLLLLGRSIRTLTAARSSALTDYILQSAKRNFAGDGELYYQLGRALQASNESAASECFGKAVALAPDEGKFVVAQAAALAKAHKEKEALALLKIMAAKSVMQEPAPRRTLVAGLVKAGVEMLAQPDPRKIQYKTSVVQITGLSCLCKVAAINFILRNQPGVVFAQVPEGKGPQNLVIYAPQQNSAPLIWNKITREAKYKILPTLSGTVIADFPSLYALASANYETPTIAPKPHYNFESLPLRQAP